VTYIPSREVLVIPIQTTKCHSHHAIGIRSWYSPNIVIMGDISSFLSEDKSLFDVEQVLKELTTLEKIDLLAGKYYYRKYQSCIC
jgi:hypothetical protein